MRIVCLLALLVLILLIGCSDGGSKSHSSLPVPATLIAAGGRVEPLGRERVVIPETTGRVARVLVDEGDIVVAGQLLAVIDNREQSARVAQAVASRDMRRTELERMRAGPRAQEIDRARAILDGVEAQAELARVELVRRERMHIQNLISEQELAEHQAQVRIGDANVHRAKAELSLLLQGNRREDIAQAEAAFAVAEAELSATKAVLAFSEVRSPIDGVVLKRVLSEGETVTALSPQPFAYLGDTQRRVVRAEVSELDLAGLHIQANAWIQADAFPGRRFQGNVTRIAGRMGPRESVTDDPAEFHDDKVIEVTIELHDAPELPVGLRVDAYIERDER